MATIKFSVYHSTRTICHLQEAEKGIPLVTFNGIMQNTSSLIPLKGSAPLMDGSQRDIAF